MQLTLTLKLAALQAELFEEGVPPKAAARSAAGGGAGGGAGEYSPSISGGGGAGGLTPLRSGC
eukprot:COSAG04_NODE_28909_length_272_cov_0.895954_1_plen_62_part_10